MPSAPHGMPSVFDPGGPFASAAAALREAIEGYAPLADDTWRELLSLCGATRLAKDEFFCIAEER